MTNPLPRVLLATSGALLLFGGVVHTLAFKKAVAAVTQSNLPDFFGKALKGLWLIDSATLITLAIVFGLIAARPMVASRSIVVLLALIPAATAGLLYYFIGSLRAAHLLVTAAALGFAGGMLLPKVRSEGSHR